MRVQNISLNNQPQSSQKTKNQNPAFNANLYGKFSTTCKDGEMCAPIKNILVHNFFKSTIKAVEAGKMKAENFIGIAEKNDGKTVEIIAVDKTTKIGKNLLEDPSSVGKNLKNIESDPETEIISIEKLKQCE